MRKHICLIFTVCSLIIAQSSFADDGGHIVVANRASGSISVIDVEDDSVTNIALPDAVNPVEPMYVNYSASEHRVFVGDRANDRVLVLNADTFELEGTIAAGNGVFHQWVDPSSRQLWINNDLDKTTTVVDARTLKVLATVPTPVDLVERGGKPHDVFVDPVFNYAYITILGITDGNDYVVQFSTRTFEETARTEVGKDPHLFARQSNHKLFVPCQNTNNVFVLSRQGLKVLDVIDVPGAHGIVMDNLGMTAYVTNISGGGTDAVYTLDAQANLIAAVAVDTNFPVPHNAALSGDNSKLYVTHSGGTADKVSVFEIPCSGCAPVLEGAVDVELNPFGLGFVP